jgi:tetratricopeptide (TPR) repeat protein
MPLTWDHSSPVLAARGAELPASEAGDGAGGEHRPVSAPEAADPSPPFEPAEFDAEGGRTIDVAAAYVLRPRFTGRAHALAALDELTRGAFDLHELGFAVVIGEPGMGRHRLVNELVSRIRIAHPTTRLVHGVADDNARAYGPIARAVAARFGISTGEDPATSRDKLSAELAEVVEPDRLPEVAHLIAHLLRVPFEDSPGVAPIVGSQQRIEARLFMALKRWLAAESERHPLLIVIEHLEQCGSDTINFLHYLAAGLRNHRVAIIGTAAPTLLTRHPAFGEGEPAPEWIEIEALEPSEAEDLLRELCPPVEELPAMLAAHVRAMPGSPRAIYELVRLLLETHCIVRDAMAWRIDHEALAALELPRSYEALVAARLAAIDALDRRLLEMAATVGDSSWLDAILALERHSQRAVGGDPDGPTLAQIAQSGDHSRLAVVTAINRLIERGWLVDVPQSSLAGERELRFANTRLWSLIYHGVSEPTRASYHAVVARWLELHPEGKTASALEPVARHLALAGDAREAAIRFRRAAETARDGFANPRAIELYDRALACVSDRDLGLRIELWYDLAGVYELIGKFDAALGALERMLRLSWVAASKVTAATAFNKMGRIWRRKGDVKLALDYLERGLDLFRGASDAHGIASSLDDIGRALHVLGRYDQAEAQISDALARHTKLGDQRAIATSLSRLGHVRQDRGQYEAAYACHRDALDIRNATGDRWGQIVARNNLAALAFELGDLPEARAGWLSVLPEAEVIGALPLSAMILTNLGELALADNKLDEAKSRLENALAIIDEVADRGLESVCCRHLAVLDRIRGNPASARSLAERALAAAQSAGLREHEAQAYMALGEVLSASIHDEDATDAGADAPAAVAFAAAIQVMADLGNDAVLARALFVFGRYRAELGDQAAAKDMLRDALMMFTKLGLERASNEVEKLLASMN